MKNVFLGFVFLFFFSGIAITELKAQNVNADPGIANSEQTNTSHLTDLAIHPRAIKDFHKYYPDAQNVNWSLINKGGYVCKFDGEQTIGRAYYSKNGNWLFSVKDMHEAQMPKDVRHLVKSLYVDYSIVFVQEIELSDWNGPIYKIQIQNDKEFLILKVSDGELEEVLKANL